MDVTRTDEPTVAAWLHAWYEGRKSYYHVYSIDCSPGIENHTMFLVQSPEDLIIREIDEAAEELLLERLAEATTHLSPTQARRLHARYALKKKFREIAADEGISGSCACDSVSGALKKMQKISPQNVLLSFHIVSCPYFLHELSFCAIFIFQTRPNRISAWDGYDTVLPFRSLYGKIRIATSSVHIVGY